MKKIWIIYYMRKKVNIKKLWEEKGVQTPPGEGLTLN